MSPGVGGTPFRAHSKLDSVGNLGIWLTAVTPGASLAGYESGEIPEECEMSIRPRLGVEVPELTARVARASNPAGTTAMWVRDRLDGLWTGGGFGGGGLAGGAAA